MDSTQFFFCDPVVLESICHHTRAYQLIDESNTTLGLRKIWTGREQKKIYQIATELSVGLGWLAFQICAPRDLIPFSGHSIINFESESRGYPFKYFSSTQSHCPRISVGLRSYDSRSTLIQLDHRKIWTGIAG